MHTVHTHEHEHGLRSVSVREEAKWKREYNAMENKNEYEVFEPERERERVK